MGDEVIKSFLVSLGFSLDESSLAKFNKSITESALKVTAFAVGIQAASAAVFTGITGIAKDFEEVGYNLRLVAPAVNKMLLLREAMISAYSRAGINLTKVVQESIKFNFSLEKTKYALDAVYKSVGAKFIPMLTKQMDIFRAKIFANMPKIQASLQKMVKFLFSAFEGTVHLGGRIWEILSSVYDFFSNLDRATEGWSTKILGAIAIWKLLNLEFLATPIGMLIAGITGLLLLWDDFRTFQEGGKSLFNWAPFIPIIDAVKVALSGLKDILGSIFTIVFDVIGAFSQLLHLNFAGFKEAMKNVFSDIGGYIQNVIGFFKDLLGVGSAVQKWLPTLGGFISKSLGGANSAPQLNALTQAQPLVNNTNNGVNQKVHQETNINVSSSANAEAVGNQVASHQNGVNFDLTRNLMGAVR